MTYYDNEKNVEQYIKMAEGFDGKLLIEVLGKYLVNGSSVLELGMGAGKDLVSLSDKYNMTGSDASDVFIQHVRKTNPDVDLLQLDAVTLNTNRQFDALYSNKVLYHLTQDDLMRSFDQQFRLLKPNGIGLHSFWYGTGSEEMYGLNCAYYTEETLQKIASNNFDVLEVNRYTEMDEDDSLYIVIRKPA